MTDRQNTDIEAPVRVCCSQRHHGPVCPDGLVMCCICFHRFPKERLAIAEEGDGLDPSSAPCKAREDRWGTRRNTPGKEEQ